ncbi:MAG: sulfatase-like hydrolase/transferase [Lentisphaeraceae bacterium]|nr:sulfatase-like hydrolase/transferase [Lentisphaeraceae bacterium]
MKLLLTSFLFFSLQIYGQQKPNIVFIFIDDMGWSDFSCFGNTDAKTTNIDKLATQGICFEQFYVNSPICSPSRVAVSTGQYPQKWKISSYLANRKTNKHREIADWLDPKAPMLARSLKKAGYATGHFGKWHMGGQRDVGDAPLITEYGFDESLTNFEGLGPRLLPLVRTPMKPEFKKIWTDSEKLGRGKVTWTDRAKITGEFTKNALKFIQKAEKNKKPFYVNIWPDDVHSPFFPSLEGWENGKDKRNLYLSVLKEMDTQLATLFDYIKTSKELKDNTLILICSDNGPEKGAGRAEKLKGYKTHLYEGGIRSSLVVWGPGIIPQEKHGTRNKGSLFSAIDLVPSILHLAGIKNDIIYDGEVLTNTLIGKSDSSRVKPIFYRRPPDRKAFYGIENLPDLSMRHGNWKLLCNYDGSNPQLYNIPKDHSESKNLIDVRPDITQKMIKEVLRWNGTLPKDNGDAQPKLRNK